MQRATTVFLLTLAWPLAAQDAALRDALAPIWDETDQAAFVEAADAVLERGASFAELQAALAAGPRYREGLPKGWSEGTMRGKDGKERPYVLFVPERYEPDRAHMLLVHLHGGVSRPQAPSHAQLRQTGWFWGEHAEEHAYLHLIPGGDGLAEEFHACVAPLPHKLSVSVRENRHMTGLRDAMLPQLLSGEVALPERLTNVGRAS